jgi:hypothetical protein
MGSRVLSFVLLASFATPSAFAQSTNQHFVAERTIALPGRGLARAWSPDGTELAAGGHFRMATPGQGKTNLRYDTKVYDVASGALVKSFDCHGFWVVALAWATVPELGRDPRRRRRRPRRQDLGRRRRRQYLVQARPVLCGARRRRSPSACRARGGFTVQARRGSRRSTADPPLAFARPPLPRGRKQGRVASHLAGRTRTQSMEGRPT